MKKTVLLFAALLMASFFAKAQQLPCLPIVLPQLSDETRKQYEQKVQEAKSK